MTPFEEYSKDWKNIAGSASSFSNDFLKQKNETIMKKLIKFEKEEKRNLFTGFTLGTLGAVLGLGLGIGLPVYHGIIDLDFPLVLGAIIMGAGLLTFLLEGLRRQIPINNADQPTLPYLKAVREQLSNRKNNMAKMGIRYVAIISLGMFCIHYSTSGGFNTAFFLSALLAVTIGILGFALWSKSYAKRETKKIRPIIEEIESMIANLQSA